MIDGFEVVDVHIHVQPWEMLHADVAQQMKGPRGDLAKIDAVFRDPGALVAYLDEEGVDTAFLINYVAPEVMGFTPAVNDWVAGFCRGREKRLAPVGSVHPALTKDPAAEVDRLIDLGIRALKIHPPHMLFHANAYREEVPRFGIGTPSPASARSSAQMADSDPPVSGYGSAGSAPRAALTSNPKEGAAGLAAIYARAQEKKLPVIVHTGTSIFKGARNAYADPMALDDVAVDFPELNVIMAHAGRPLYMETCFFLLRRHPNLRIDVSGIPPSRLLEYVPRLAEVSGRALWGTDWPSMGVPSMGGNVRAFLGLALADDVKRAILAGNARALFGLPR